MAVEVIVGKTEVVEVITRAIISAIDQTALDAITDTRS